MSKRARVLVFAFAVLALGLGFLVAPKSSRAADDDKQAKEIQAVVLKLADAIEKNNADETKKQTAALAKFELLPVMKQLKLRGSNGIGFGTPGVVPPNQDGVEAKLIAMARKPMLQADVVKQAGDVARAAAILAALAEITTDKCTVKKKMGEKDPKEWAKLTEDMKKGAKDLITAAKAKDADKINAASKQLYGSCTSCHSIFRD